MYCERRVHITWMIEGHLDGGHQVRQLATAVDNTPNTDGLRLCKQLVDVVHRDFGLPFFLCLVAHGPRKRYDGGTWVWLSMVWASCGSGSGAGAQLRSRWWCLLIAPQCRQTPYRAHHHLDALPEYVPLTTS